MATPDFLSLTPDRLSDCLEYVQTELARQADPEKAAGMQAYMKTDMPFYGVQRRGQIPIIRHVARTWPPTTQGEYENLVLAIWELAHREEKTIAQKVAAAHKDWVTPVSIPVYRRFIVEGAWWDFVDETATHLIRPLVIHFPGQTWPTVEQWAEDDHMWLRRAAIICQVGAKSATDPERLFGFCEARAREKEFFIRKGIGWALREYSKSDPEAVAAFALRHKDELSGLSFREATKHIKNLVE